MAYDEQFVLCVLHKGSPVREIGGTIHLPFNSDYKVRLKNKNSVRAKARVWIDGRQVSNLGDFILQPNETLDLERFLDQSMTSGNKFKFVPLGDGRVNDPTDLENGIIKVEFYKEIQPYFPNPRKSFIRSNTHKSYGFGPEISGTNANWQYTPTFTTGGKGTACSTSVNYVSSNSLMPICDSYISEDAGATVEGGHSGQSFVYANDFPTETHPTTLTLRVRGLKEGSFCTEPIQYDWQHKKGEHPKKRIKFCPNCGAKRHGMAKFCASCGTAYHPRYERERGRIVR